MKFLSLFLVHACLTHSFTRLTFPDGESHKSLAEIKRPQVRDSSRAPEGTERTQQTANRQATGRRRDSCLFAVKFDDLTSFQVEIGKIIDYQQPDSAIASGSIAMCDDFKCSGLDPQHVMATVQGVCDDDGDNETKGRASLDLTIATSDSGTLDVVCPDLVDAIDFDCHVFELGNGSPAEYDDVISDTEIAGPFMRINIDSGYLAKCTILCQERDL